ncbi:MAG: HD domain-containing protein [Clostridia bacterium]|nr:HD domain-containing protein [Clostridia bacterium]
MRIIDEAIAFVILKVKDKKLDFESSHPWRTPGLHILQHGLRVKALAEEIYKSEKNSIDENEFLMMQVACILHDIGTVEGKNLHAEKSAVLSKGFLEQHFNEEVVKRILFWIEKHSDKSEIHEDEILKFIKDADIIEEFGVQSVLMSSNWINRETAFFFHDLEERMHTKEIAFGYKLIEIAQTKSGKSIIEKKLRFMEEMINQLAYENRGSLTYENYKTFMS